MEITMRVTFPEEATSPVKVLVDGTTYAVAFERHHTVLVPGPIGLELVNSSLARDFGPVLGLTEWSRVTPAWRPEDRPSDRP
jgi:hypothetical protein